MTADVLVVPPSRRSPLRPEDAEIEQEFIRRLSPESEYFRLMPSLTELTLETFVRFRRIDYDRERAFIAVRGTPQGEQELAVGRYVTNPDAPRIEICTLAP